MIVALDTGAQRLAQGITGRWIHVRVTAGTVNVAPNQQDAAAAAGLSLTSADGLRSLVWETPELWAAGTGGSRMEILTP